MGEAPAGAGYVMPSVEHEPFVRSDDYGERGLQKQNVLERARLFVARVTIMPLEEILPSFKNSKTTWRSLQRPSPTLKSR